MRHFASVSLEKSATSKYSINATYNAERCCISDASTDAAVLAVATQIFATGHAWRNNVLIIFLLYAEKSPEDGQSCKRKEMKK